jgi:hypothetical protein
VKSGRTADERQRVAGFSTRGGARALMLAYVMSFADRQVLNLLENFNVNPTKGA